MALTIPKLVTSNATKYSFIRSIKNQKIAEIIPHKPQYQFPQPFNIQIKSFLNEAVSIIEIPPPYCTICNKFMTTNQCNSVIRPKNCPLH
tara:strand:- start:2748 stop:3017 length:270 start_codon:yes stop_codon:yes gene_type:complete